MMSRSKYFLSLAVALVVLAGCQGLPRQSSGFMDDDTLAAKAGETSKPVAVQPELTPDLLYSILAGEIAAQRGEFRVAFNHYLHAARLASDPRAAERATRLGLIMKDDESTLEAVLVWIDLQPNDVAAHQIASVINAHQDRKDEAVRHLEEVVRINKERGQNGYLQAGHIISRIKGDSLRMALMDKLVSEHQDNPEAMYAYAAVAARSKHLPQAEAAVRKALELRPHWIEGQVLLSQILKNQGDTKGAQSVLQKGLQSDPGSLVLRMAYARMLVESQDFKTAYEQYSRLREKEPENSDVLFALGVLALQLENLPAARIHFQELTDQKAHTSEAAYFLGQVEVAEGNDSKAIDWFSKVTAKYRIEAQTQIAQLYAKQGETKQAREKLQQLRDSVDRSEMARLYLIEGEILREAKQNSEAMGLYDDALQVFPDNEDLLYARALHAVAMGRLDIMELDLRRLIDKNPSHADALNALGYTLADQTSRYNEALGFIERALALKPDNAAILDSMGWVQYRLGNNEEALSYLRRAMEIMPDSEIAAHLGEVLWATGAKESAKSVWDKALSRDPESEHLLKVIQRHR